MNQKPKDAKQKSECECGCGGVTRGGRFLPGHDAKLKKSLVQEAIAGSKRAEGKLEKLGWTRFLEAKRTKQEATLTDRAAKEAPKPKGRRTKATLPQSSDPKSAAERAIPEAASEQAPRRRGRRRKGESPTRSESAPAAVPGEHEAEASRS